MKLYELLLLLQLQIHSKCEFAEKNVEIKLAEEAAAQAAQAAAAAVGAAAAAAEASSPESLSVSASVPARKLSGSSLSDSVRAQLASTAAAAGTPADAPVAAPPSKTEFEYVPQSYEWEGADEEIVGKSSSARSKKLPTARFGVGHLLCHKETLFLMKSRWDNLISSFYDPKCDTFDPTKLPDVYGQTPNCGVVRRCIAFRHWSFTRFCCLLFVFLCRLYQVRCASQYGLLIRDSSSVLCHQARGRFCCSQ
jgi:hypothetical protein